MHSEPVFAGLVDASPPALKASVYESSVIVGYHRLRFRARRATGFGAHKSAHVPSEQCYESESLSLQGLQNGWWRTLRRFLFQGIQLGSPPRPNRSSQPQRRRPVTRSHSSRFAGVISKIQKMPVEQYVSAEGLRNLPAHQLKVSTHLVQLSSGSGSSTACTLSQAVYEAVYQCY